MQRQLGQSLAARGGGRQHPVQQALDVEEQANGVGLRIVEVMVRDERPGDVQRLKRRPQIARREPVQALRLRTEAAADALGRQVEEGPDGADTELVQAVAERRGDPQPIERHPPCQRPFAGGIADHRHRLVAGEGPGDRLGAEPREADRDHGPEAARPQRHHNVPRPASQRRMQTRQPGGVQPEDPRLVAGRLDVGAEPVQALGDRSDPPLDVGGRHLAGVQGVGQRQTGTVAHPGPHAGRPSLLVDLEDHALRLVAIHHRHRPAGPAGVALQQELQRECRQLNARHPVHGNTPRRAIPGRAACP